MVSKILYGVCACFLLYTSFVFYPKWNKYGSENTLSYDAARYYWYLPSLFIYHDIKHQGFNDSIVAKYHPLGNDQPGYKLRNGNMVLKYPAGVALMSSPFFWIANMSAKPLGYPQDGFSPPYPLAIQIGGILVALLGLWYFRKLLLLYYSDKVVAACLFLLVFGTNYLDFAGVNLGMSHSWLFTIYVFLLLNTHYFYNRNYQYIYAIRIGLLIGLATLTRPTEIISAIIPLLWGLERLSFKEIQKRFWFLVQQWEKILLTVFCAAAVASIQLIYWKYVSGHWLVYSYQEQGFSWLHPHFKDYTISFDSGWLIYSPVMIFAFIGIIPFIRAGKNKIAILLFFVVDYYIVASWDVWTYGGRAMIQSYPVLFFPVASMISAMTEKKWLFWLTSPVLILFIYYNFWLEYQLHYGGLVSPGGDYTTSGYFWRVAGRWHVPDDVSKLKDNRDYFNGEPKNLHLIYSNNFENDTSLKSPLHAINGNRSVYLDKDHPYSPIYKFAYQAKMAKWIRAEASFKCVNKEWTPWSMRQFVIHFYSNKEEVKNNILRVDRFINNGEIKTLFVDARVPKTSFDSIGISFFNPGSEYQMLADDLKVYSFDE